MSGANIRIPDCPYKGLMPYSEEDAPFFFGREAEKEIINANLIASRLTLMYGPSGVGKSSVLRAGVSHDLREISLQSLSERGAPEFAVVVFNSWRDDPILGLLNQVRDSVALALNVKEPEPIQQSGTLVEALDAWTKRISGDILIILDQFEEYFLYHPQEDGQGTFAFEFPRVVNRRDLRVSFLISIRDDSLAKLDRFKGRIPNLFDNYLRIDHLRYEAGKAAIEKPVERYNNLRGQKQQAVSVEPELVEAVLEQIRTGQVSLSEGGKGFVTSDSSVGPEEVRIETPYLQLVMNRLWEKDKRSGSHSLRRSTLKDLGGAKNIVLKHVDNVMKALPPQYQEAASRVFYHLVTPGGTKIAHTIADLAKFAKLQESQLSPLLDKLARPTARILRPVAPPSDKPKTLRYEVFHDVLAVAILVWRARYVQAKKQKFIDEKQKEKHQQEIEAERERAEQAQLLAEEKARSARRRLIMLAALAVMFVVAVLSAGIAVKYYRAQKGLTETQKDLTERAENLSKQLNMFLTSRIEELKNNPNTREIAENWEKQLEKQLKGTIKPPPPHTIVPKELRGNVEDLRKLIEAHNEVLKKLSAGNSLADKATAKIADEFSELYDTLKVLEQLEPFFDDTTSTGKDLKDLQERIQKIENIRSQSEFIKGKNSLQDKVLSEFCKFAVEKPSFCTPGELEKLDDLARRLAYFVSDPNWPKKFRMDVMAEENPLYEKIDLPEMDFEKWLSEAEGYRVLEPDPRQQYLHLQKQIIQEIRENINEVRTNLPGQASEFQKRLDTEIKRIRKLPEVPAIVKYGEDINNTTAELKVIWERLDKLKSESIPLGIPSWCKRVSIDRAVSGGKYTMALLSRQLRDKFVPISTSHKRPIEVVQGSYQELRREDFVEEKYQLVSSLNAGWPKYIASSKDPSVALRFIPAGSGNPDPFYMATHEITNAQYRMFLVQTGARSETTLSTRSWFVESQSDEYLVKSDPDYKACGIIWDNLNKTFIIEQEDINIPVVYVTFYGAQSYAKWLGGQLPDAKQHRYACRAGTDSKYFWGNDLSEIANYAHVRAGDWLKAKNAYNSKVGSFFETKDLPLGAVRSKDFIPYKTKLQEFGPDEIVHSYNTAYNSAWPVPGAKQPNDWDLYDMIGNVWEWCQGGTKSVICGGSCLAPPEYILEPESNYIYRYDETACDVGFRIIAPAK